MRKIIPILLAIAFLFSGCSILSKVYVRNFFDHEITVTVENLWIKEKIKTSTTALAAYTPKIVGINSSTYKKLTDSLEMSYDAKGKLSIKIPAKSTVLLEVMGNAAPAQNIEIYVFGIPKGTLSRQILAEYSIEDFKRKRFHKYCLDIKP